jgi:two-component system sensor histidine kinase ChiS
MGISQAGKTKNVTGMGASVSLRSIDSLEILSPFDSFAEMVALKYRIGNFLSRIADTVNTASRIEGLIKYYGASILLSEDSWEQCGAHSECASHFRYLGKVQVKGKKEPFGLYECYDGDQPEIAKRKVQTQPIFEKGLELFFDREFPEAAATFSKVLKVNPDDQPARLFMNKSSENLLQGVPEDWTGVEVMTFK